MSPRSESERARDAALRLLAVRARTVAELRRRLRRKDFASGTVEAVLDRLRGEDLLDDEAFARDWIRERIARKPRGRFALVQELAKRGIDRGRAGEAVDEVLASEGLDEAEIARRAAEEWVGRRSEGEIEALRTGSPEARFGRVRRRLYSHLERRGFPRGLARRVVDRFSGGGEP